MNTLIASLLSIPLALSVTLTSCNRSRDEEPEVKPIIYRTQSIADGAEVDASTTTQLKLTFNEVIEINAAKPITLNQQTLTAMPTGMEADISLQLEEGTTYLIEIPTGAFVKKGDASVVAPAKTIAFTTKASPVRSIAPLTNTHATQEAKNVYNFLVENYGKRMLSGVQNTKAYITDFANTIYTTTGKYPTISGYDFIFLAWPADSWYGNYSSVEQQKAHWDKNGLIAITWHWNVPSKYENRDKPDAMGFYNPGSGSSSTTFDIREALKEGTWQNEVLLRDIDRAAASLQKLQEANIPVLWRPLHEAAGDYQWGSWFWWGRHGVQHTKQLWKLIYDRMTNLHGLNNLIWVWTAQTAHAGDIASLEQLQEAYPGNNYVDIVGADLYYNDNNAHPTEFKLIELLVEGKKIVTLSECGNLFIPEKCMQAGDHWSWFMSWCDDGFTNWNSVSIWNRVMNDPSVMNREDMPSLK